MVDGLFLRGTGLMVVCPYPDEKRREVGSLVVNEHMVLEVGEACVGGAGLGGVAESRLELERSRRNRHRLVA